MDDLGTLDSVFGRRLRQTREAAGITILGLADRLHVSPKTIERWEEGDTNASIEKAADAAKELGVSLDYLAGLANGEAVA